MYAKPYKQYYKDLYAIQDAVFEIVEEIIGLSRILVIKIAAKNAKNR